MSAGDQSHPNQINMYKETDLDDFKTFLQVLQKNNYTSIFFHELTDAYNQVIIRHDIDFDVRAAWEVAKIEHELGIKATFFFLVTNDSYNPFAKENYSMIHEIKTLGHTISVHFDPTIYDDFEKGFAMEKKCFEDAFDSPVDIISLHRPNEYFQRYDKPILGCDHTYMKKYFKDLKYVSDSGGIFRYGHPFNTPEFKNKESLHILTHPIWWIFQGTNNHEKLKNFYGKKKELLKTHYSLNCIPFKEIRNELN